MDICNDIVTASGVADLEPSKDKLQRIVRATASVEVRFGFNWPAFDGIMVQGIGGGAKHGCWTRV